ncbi:MCE family protein [Haloechinothrix sp. YIM 98757]|uniref:MCE family protein n=1 Tax=Haloechinothrix aidingensis TaxID=2752311 RepID=A0A838AC13_9PSEU|nr:MCE family protein [Haloechinothrix aidingensis]
MAGVIAVASASVQGGGDVPGKAYTRVTAAFEDVGTLTERQNVTQAGVRIGTVDSIDYQEDVAHVVLRLEGQRKVFGNARAEVLNESALGKKYIEFDPGTPDGGPLDSGIVPTSQTSSSRAVDDVFSAFDEPTREALQSSLQELGGGIIGHSKDLRDVIRSSPDMLSDLGLVSGALSSEEAELPAMLSSANRFAGRFRDRERELTSLLENLNTTFDAISVDNGEPLEHSIQALPSTLREARRGLDALNAPLADLESALVTLEPGGQALGAAADDLRGVLREAVDPMRKLPGVSEDANPAVEDLTHTISDARPLVPRVARAVEKASPALGDLAAYSTGIGRMLSHHDMLSGRFAPDKHYFSAMAAFPGLYNVGLPDPTVETNPYPEPGEGAEEAPESGGNR